MEQPNLPVAANKGAEAPAVAKPTEKPTAAAAGAMKVAKKNETRKECAIITRLEEKGEDSLRAVILQLTGGDTLFVDKFAECCKQQVNKHWKKLVGADGKTVWSNPFLVIPLNSQLEALYKCASRKILPDGYNCNLIPYLGRDEKRVDVSIDYKGLIDTLIKEGIIKDADAKEVCYEDDFDWNMGEVTRWHIDFRKPRGSIIGYCAWAVLPDGRKKWHFMTSDEIDDVRKCAKTQMIWNKWEGEMSKKTAIRRLFKTLPNTPRLQKMLELDNENFIDMDEGEDGRFAQRGTTRRKQSPVRQIVGAQAQLPSPESAEEAAPSDTEVAAEAGAEAESEREPVFA